RAFVDEASEHLEAFGQALLQLEQDPGAAELVDQAFRDVHTVKGAAGFLAFAAIERLSHAGEGVLARVRAGELVVSPRLVSLLLSMSDVLAGHLDDIRATGAERSADD